MKGRVYEGLYGGRPNTSGKESHVENNFGIVAQYVIYSPILEGWLGWKMEDKQRSREDLAGRKTIIKREHI